MLNVSRALAGIFLLGLLGSATTFAGDANQFTDDGGYYDDPDDGDEGDDRENEDLDRASVHVNDDAESTVMVYSNDAESRTLLFKFDPNRQLMDITLASDESSPLKTDEFLDVHEMLGFNVEYHFETPSLGNRIVQVLGIPTGGSYDAETVQEYSPWRMELPYGMQNTDYLQKEWGWPADHNGVVALVEYEGKGRWGFFEVTRSKVSRLNRITYYLFETPTPTNAEDLAHQIRINKSWPKFKEISSHEFTPNNYRRTYYDLAPTHDYHDDKFLSLLQESPRYREVYDQFVNKSGSTEVVSLFNKLLKLARADGKKALKATPDADEGNKLFIDNESHWAVFHFLSISSAKNLNILWTHFSKEIYEVILKDPESLVPRFYSAAMNLGVKDRRVPLIMADFFINHFSQNKEDVEAVRFEIENWLRNWMMASPHEVYETIREVKPSSNALFLIKEILSTIPHNRLDPRLLGWAVEVLVESHSEVDDIATKEKLAIKDLKRWRRDQPNLWRSMMDHGQVGLDFSCADLITRLGASKTL